jgi:hypothetical protein
MRPRAWMFVVLAVAAGAAGIVATSVSAPAGWLPAYLVAWLYWTGISLGSLSILLLHNLTGGAWGNAIRSTMHAAASTLLLLAIMFLPIALHVGQLYPWANASLVEHEPSLQHKRLYLNSEFFQARAVFYFVIWLALLALLRWQSRVGESADERTARRIGRLSGQGLALHGVVTTFAAIDWTMSLEPEWFSTIYGVLVFVSQGLAAFAFGVLVFCAGAGRAPAFSNVRHDLGKLLLAFVMLWAYMAFSQFLIIWYGNLSEEVIWYKRRLERGWEWLALALVLFHFAVPFVLLLSRSWKRSAARLAFVAVMVLLMNWGEKIWMIEPATDSTRPYSPLLDVVTFLVVGGFWCVGYALNLPDEESNRFAAMEVRNG